MLRVGGGGSDRVNISNTDSIISLFVICKSSEVKLILPMFCNDRYKDKSTTLFYIQFMRYTLVLVFAAVGSVGVRMASVL